MVTLHNPDGSVIEFDSEQDLADYLAANQLDVNAELVENNFVPEPGLGWAESLFKSLGVDTKPEA